MRTGLAGYGDGCLRLHPECNDGSYYVGTTRDTLERRVGEHNAGAFPRCYTKSRRPVKLVFHQEFQQITDAIAAERRLKGWRRAKKEALIGGDFERLKELAAAYERRPHPSTGSG